MPRSALFAAVTLAVAGSGLALGAAPAHAAPSTPSLRVVAPCENGPGTVVVTARAGEHGGTAAATRIRGVTHQHWTGQTFIGEAALEDDPETTTLGAVGGVVTDRAVSTKSWPRLAGAIFSSKRGHVNCLGFVKASPTRDVGAGSDAGVLVRRNGHAVWIGIDAPTGSRWRVAVTLKTPRGTQRLAKRVRAGRDGVVTWLTGFRRVNTYTSASLRATNLRTHRVVSLRLVRGV